MFSHSTFSWGGHGFLVSPSSCELTLPPYRTACCIISGSQTSGPRMDTVVPKKRGSVMPTMVHGVPLTKSVLPTASALPPRLLCQ